MSEQCVTPWDRATTVFRIDLSILTRLVPLEMVRDVLEQARVVSRTRRTSAVLGMYLVMALTLFPEVSTVGVFEKLVGVWGRPGAGIPSRASLKERLARLGVTPFQELFARPRSAGAQVPRAMWRGLLLCARDGTTLRAPDSPANVEAFGKPGNQHGKVGFPLIRVLVLVACGSRALIDAAVDASTVGENPLAGRLLGSLKRGMLLLADRNFLGCVLWCRCVGTEAELMWRIKKNVRLEIIRVLPDGSALAWWPRPSSVRKADRAGLPDRVLVRVISGWITVIDADGVRRSEQYRLLTTLLDHELHTAGDLVRLYGHRWQVELMIKGLKCVQGAARLRSKTPDRALQETWAWLCTHQLLRLEAANAAEDAAGPGPANTAQISFTSLVQRFRDAVIYTGRNRGSADQTLSELRHATREDVTPIDTRVRVYDRVGKCPVSKFPSKKSHHGGRIVAYEYSIDPATGPTATAPQTATTTATTSANANQTHPEPVKINS